MDEELWSEARKICRICLRIDPRSSDIFNSYYVERHTLYCDMLAYCTKFKLHPKDGLPPYMCRNCIEHLEDMYEFHLECEESEKNFLWLLSVR
ncbi:hypothetical protein PYW08_008852 [Mythimna loreyi]|uniref:Uncharacterized protein n=1 Tax=Mythimna loreyi TaxID=667449 RepID=A0ACC2QA65_9NEOP|nr:hypothetical protein PYW08_008852 [Mythimna loreyi]